MVVFVFCVLVFVGASVRSERILREAPALPPLRVGPVAVAKTQQFLNKSQRFTSHTVTQI